MTYNKIYKILSFENTKLITTKLLCSQKIIKSSSLVVQSNMEPKLIIYIYIYIYKHMTQKNYLAKSCHING
jgi:hypothetical protein